MSKQDRYEPVEIALFVHHETEKAVLVSEDEKTKVWLPLSQIEIDQKPYEKEKGTATVTMPLWLAEKSKFAGY